MLREPVSAGTVARAVVDAAVDVAKSGKPTHGVMTGFDVLDEFTGGFQPGTLIVVSGRPGMGKSAFVLNVALHMAVERRSPVLVFSLDGTRDEVAKRLICAQSSLAIDKFRVPGLMKETDMPLLARAVDALSDSPLLIDDSFSPSPAEIRKVSARAARDHNGRIGLIVVDYAQLLRPDTQRLRRSDELSDASGALKSLAKEISAPVILVAPSGRGSETRDDKRPRLADLPGSGSLAQDADLVLFIHRMALYDPDAKPVGYTEIIIARHRDGPTGTFVLEFDPACQRFDAL